MATTSASFTTSTITGLTNGQSYDFEIFAMNGVGTSSPSNIVSSTPVTTSTAPYNLSATAGNAEATISFSAPTSTGGSSILYYTATASNGGFFATSTGSPITVEALSNGTGYTFTVTATNGAGTSASSSPSNSVTPSGAYPSVSSFTASRSDIQPGVSSTLSWTIINASSVAIDQGIGSVASSSGSFIVTPTTTLIYTLTATNVSGSTTAQTTILVDGIPPSAPTSVTANAVSQAEIDLLWASSTDNVGVTGYDVYQGASTSTLSLIATTTGLSYRNTGLSAATTFYYAIAAYDDAGNISVQSSFVSATTQSASSGGGGGGGSSGGGGGGYYYATPITTSETTSTIATGEPTTLPDELLDLVAEVRALSLQMFLANDKNQNLTIGSMGSNVWALQVFLIMNNIISPTAQGLKLVDPTGYFGTITRGALASYQANVGITPPSGFLGPKTRAYLENIP